MGTRCPRCGQGPLFDGLLAVRSSCPACGLDYSKVDSGDGPAVFVILIVGAVVVGLVLFLQVRYEPPEWVALLVALPLILALSIGLLRPMKGWLIGQQYRHRATQDIELR